MGNREYVETYKDKPNLSVGNGRFIYVGKGMYMPCTVVDVRYHNLANVWIVKSKPIKGAKKIKYKEL